MRIFVTTGTLFPFDSLVKSLDENTNPEYNFVFQIGNGSYIPSRNDYFRFSNNIEKFISESELVICHAGAGTIFQLLEMKKKFIAVPNLERKDQHQKDICDFLQRQSLAGTVLNLNELNNEILRVQRTNFKTYYNDNTNLINGVYNFIISK